MQFPIKLDFARSAAVDPRVVFTRASSAITRRPGGNWKNTPTNTPRLHHDEAGNSLGLILQPSTVSELRNTMGDGIDPADTTVRPTFWTNPTTASGITPAYSHNTHEGSRVVSIDLTGTPTQTTSWTIEFEGRSTGMATSSGQRRTGQVGLRINAGSLANFSLVRLRALGATAAGSTLFAQIINGSDIGSQLTSRMRTFDFPYTFGTDATLARCTFGLQLGVTTGQPVALLLDVLYPDDVPGPLFPPILKPLASPASATQAAESATASLASWGLLSTQRGTLLLRFRTPSVAPVSVNIAQATGSSASNRIRARASSGGGLVVDFVVSDSLELLLTSVGVLAASTDYTLAVTWEQGRAALSLNGAAVVEGVPPSLPPTENLEAMASGATMERIYFSPASMANAALQTLARQGPIS